MHEHMLEAIISVGMALWLFGNINVIVAIWRKKILRTKGSMFVLILAITHLICNFSEIIGLVTQLRFTPMSRKKCFEYNLVYLFAMMFQSALFFSIALDLCFSIMLPIKHMIWNKHRYVTIMCIFPLIFAISTSVTSFIFIPDEQTPYCIFMLTTDIRIYQMVSTALIVLNSVTLVIILCSVLAAVRKSENMRGSRHSTGSRTNSLREEKHKVFRSTFFLVLIYIVSWWSVVVIFRIMVETIHDVKDVIHYIPYLVIVVMPNYCQAYYVTYLRSPRFRKAFREQLNWLTCGFCFPKIFEKKHEKREGKDCNGSVISYANNDSGKKNVRQGSHKCARFAQNV
uniref:G_PROTEIN_RECEP_F1_2 domain-containing protein n=2 Tax=Caenorhabditis japonica TaxID=281687 RepID=A0A8R1E053_CAEJA